MTENIRDGVFETNSSSSHSVTVVPGEIVDFGLDKETLRGGRIRAELDGYGRSWHRYYKPENKIAYLVTSIADADFLYELPPDENAAFALRRHSPVLEKLIAGVERLTGCVLEIIPGDNAYVDHQALESGIVDELVRDPDAALAFVFSGSYIQTGSDEHFPGEFIRTDRGDEPAHTAFTVDTGAGDAVFDLDFLADDDRTVTLSVDGKDVASATPGFANRGIFESLRGATATRIVVGDGDDPAPADQRGRDAAFHYLAYVNRNANVPRLSVLGDATIVGEGSARPFMDEYEIPFRISCVAPEQTLEAIKEALAAHAPAPKRGR